MPAERPTRERLPKNTMEPSADNSPFPKYYILAGLILLSAGLLFGITGALQYVIPGFLKDYFSFERVRPMHVSSVVFWIIMGATGSVLTYVQEHSGKKLYSTALSKVQFFLFVFAIVSIFISYVMGVFGGREYWEYPPVLSIPIVLAWLCFIVNFTASVGSFRRQPVYVWMWLTGAVFFLFTFTESYLWLFPHFRNNVVNDMTIQWKSYGSMVGSWNMLVYGCSAYLMDKISGDTKTSHSGLAFALYFTGLFNLLFNWGHHIYTLPTHNYVKHISYAVSMTELVLLGRMIYKWKSSLTTAQKYFHREGYRFIAAADVWVFLNLMLAIAMSVPVINVYTHGTHITVAHSMGATIGINTMLLLALAHDILGRNKGADGPHHKLLTTGYWLANFSLFVFWISLIAAGVLKARWQMSAEQIPFSTMMLQLRPLFISFTIAGVLLSTGLYMSMYPLFRTFKTRGADNK